MNYTRIKICGITNIEDALYSISLGADALGFIFCESPRQINIAQAKSMLSKLPPFVNKVAVVKDFTEKQIAEIIAKLPIDTIQFSGHETENFCFLFNSVTVIKAISMKSNSSLKQLRDYSRLSYFLLDTYSKQGGGSGKTFNWDLATQAKQFGKVILAGGLNPSNIKSAIDIVTPYGVDVSSGVEKSHGVKDHAKLKAFFQSIR